MDVDERELQRLYEMYGGQSDGQVEAAWVARDSFTDAAQAALKRVMVERGLFDSRGMLVGQASAEVYPVEAGEEVDELGLAGDEAWVWGFQDAMEAGSAIRVLEDGGIDCRVMPGLGSGRGSGILNLIVKAADEVEARRLLQEKLSLPLVRPAVGDGDAGEFVMLSMYERGEALKLAGTLGAAGISYRWRDGKDEVGELPDEETVAIEVRAGMLERAVGLVG